eukprot:15466216-Alexandrium_andersonii.AAC.1
MRSRHTHTRWCPRRAPRELSGESPRASDPLEAPAHSAVPAQSPPRVLESSRASAQEGLLLGFSRNPVR